MYSCIKVRYQVPSLYFTHKSTEYDTSIHPRANIRCPPIPPFNNIILLFLSHQLSARISNIDLPLQMHMIKNHQCPHHLQPLHLCTSTLLQVLSISCSNSQPPTTNHPPRVETTFRLLENQNPQVRHHLPMCHIGWI